MSPLPPAAGQSAAPLSQLRDPAGERGGGERGELHQRVQGEERGHQGLQQE